MAGFNSPNIMFLNTYDALDRRYMSELVPKLIREGYTRYVELYAGGFAMPVVMATAGIKPENMVCYDISLYSSILGFTFSGKDLQSLGVKKDGETIDLPEDNCKAAAILLYEQALARLQKAENILYFKYLVDDLILGKDYHLSKIEERIKRMDNMLHGMKFERMYIWSALEKEHNSEHTFIVSNPPTYKGAYEKFFDTDGKITSICDTTEYEVWDGKIHCKKFMERASNAKPLIFLLQQADKGKAATKEPVSSRYLSLTQNVYYNTNRPNEVRVINGLKETTASDVVRTKSKFPIMPPDYLITKESKMSVFVEKTQISEYYRKIWLHRINGKSVSVNLCVIVDGYIAGFIGLDLNSLVRPYNDKSDFIILSYAVPAPNTRLRNARLLVHIAKSKRILTKAIAASTLRQYLFYISLAEEIVTIEYSRYQEVKGLRGLMKLRSKKKINDEVTALSYYAKLDDRDESMVLNEFIEIEDKYANGKKHKDCRPE